MAVELVIKISKEDYERLKEYKKAPFNSLTSRTYEAIANGTPLSKGHGRLIDADALENVCHEEFLKGMSISAGMVNVFNDAPTIIEADKKQKDWHDKRSSDEKAYKDFCKDYLKLRDIWNCKECEHTEDECKDCYPELGYKNDKLKRDTEAVEKFVESDAFPKLMESLDKQDRAATEDAEQFLRDIKAKEQEE